METVYPRLRSVSSSESRIDVSLDLVQINNSCSSKNEGNSAGLIPDSILMTWGSIPISEPGDNKCLSIRKFVMVETL